MAIEVDLYLKEGLQVALFLVSNTASTNALLHLVKRELSSMQECLIHRPVVIL